MLKLFTVQSLSEKNTLRTVDELLLEGIPVYAVTATILVEAKETGRTTICAPRVFGSTDVPADPAVPLSRTFCVSDFLGNEGWVIEETL